MVKRKRPRKSPGEPLDSTRPRNLGLPDPKTIVSERTFVSPKGTRFRIIRTTEKDPYDPDDGNNNSKH